MSLDLDTTRKLDGMMFVMAPSRISCLGAHMGEVVQFIPKRDLERVCLIREARAIYEPSSGGPRQLAVQESFS
jgi:hypothetical protein